MSDRKFAHRRDAFFVLDHRNHCRESDTQALLHIAAILARRWVCQSHTGLLAEMEAKRILVSPLAQEAMTRPERHIGKREVVKFAQAKLYDLGFRSDRSTQMIRDRVIELWHRLCELYDAPALRLSLTDEPPGNYFYVAMAPVTLADKLPYIFWLARIKVRVRSELGACVARRDERWALGQEFGAISLTGLSTVGRRTQRRPICLYKSSNPVLQKAAEIPAVLTAKTSEGLDTSFYSSYW